MKKWFNNLKISSKIRYFGMFSALIIVVLAMSLILQLFFMKKDVDSLYLNRVVRMKELKKISDMYVANIINNSQKVSNKTITWQQGIDNIKKAQSEINENLENYTNSDLLEEEKTIFDEFLVAKGEADKTAERLIDAMSKRDASLLENLIKSALYQRIDVVTGKVDKLIEFQLTIAEEIYEKNSIRYFTTLIFSIVIIIALLLAQLVIGSLITNSIRKQIASFNELFFKMSQGDLTENYVLIAQGKSKNEMDLLGENYNKLVDNLKKIMRDMTKDSNQTTMSAVTLSEGMNIISEATQMQTKDVITLENQVQGLKEKMETVLSNIKNQTSSVEESSEGISEISKNMENIFSSTQKTIKISEETKNAAQKGEKSARDSFEEIKKMEKIISEIVVITGSISKISEQTNLLALNAAIEAARAGEAGRGFSIVAEEVRKLADMTKTSANDIGKMLNTAKDTMKQNLSLAEHSGEQLKEIINKVEKTNEEIEKVFDAVGNQKFAVEEITSSIAEVSKNSASIENLSVEQIEVFEQISEGINSISRQAQAISLGTEESLEIAQELSGIADSLNNMITVFKISDETKTDVYKNENSLNTFDHIPEETNDIAILD